MKATVRLLWVWVLVSSVGFAAEKGHWTGWLTDAKCAANGAKSTHKGCAMKCVEAGQAIVFVAEDKKVYKLQGAEKVKSLVGDKVVLSGTVEQDTITIESAKKSD